MKDLYISSYPNLNHKVGDEYIYKIQSNFKVSFTLETKYIFFGDTYKDKNVTCISLNEDELILKPKIGDEGNISVSIIVENTICQEFIFSIKTDYLYLNQKKNSEINIISPNNSL